MKKKRVLFIPLISLIFLFSSFSFLGLNPQIINATAATKITESKTSKLGHIRSTKVKIYDDLISLNSYKTAGNNYTNKVYYIKKQAVRNGQTYYLISTKPSSNKGVIGWVKSNDMSIRDHKTVDKISKTMTIKGTGSAYAHAWGGSKDLVFQDMSKFANKEFKVNLTETVGNNVWYRGTIDGQTVWLHSSFLLEIDKTSKLGHLRSKAEIYKIIGDRNSTISSSEYLNKVYYIKQQSVVNGETYYLISTQPSRIKGIVGWVKANDMSVHDHKTIDKKAKTLFIKGTGSAYAHAWGGSKDLVYEDMSIFANQPFKVDLTETVGNNTWYRGTLNNKRVWLHSSYVYTIEKSNVSRLGHLRSGATIYKEIEDPSSAMSSADYLNKVYYIKQQAKVGNQTYYLISTKPSKTDGVIGWVNSTEMSTHEHKTVDKKAKTLIIKGTGSAYAHAWGGQKDLVYKDLSPYAGQNFEINLTETVGENTWYRGILDGRTAWIHSSYLTQQNIKFTNYNITISEALDLQMQVSPQTDKYRNDPAYVSAAYINFDETSYINGDGVRLRSSPKLDTNNNIEYTVNYGTEVKILNNNVKGDSYKDSTIWYEIEYKNQKLFVHSALVDTNKVPVTTTNLNVRSKPNSSSSSHVYGVLPKGSIVNIVKELDGWYQITYSTWRNATRSDVEYYLNPNNFQNDEKQRFQFLDLSKPSGATVEQLNKFLESKGVLKGQGKAFIKAAEENNINDIYLISHAILETGNGTSTLAKGVVYNGKYVYNVYGIGAIDSDPIGGGAKTAYEKGWFTVEDAIIGGAKFIGEDYIKGKNSAGTVQNTIYKMRWNPEAMDKLKKASHQYATDIGWAYKQINNIYNIYNSIGISNIQLEIPKYK